MSKNKIRVGITHGDIGGISYEIIIKTLMDQRIMDLCTPIVYGSKVAADYHKKLLKDDNNFSWNMIPTAETANPKRANMVVCCDESSVKMELGVPTPLAGQLAIASLNRAVKELKEGLIDVLVTCPINKRNTAGDDFGFIGHTEYLAAQFEDKEPLMFMISEDLKVGLVTMHIPLKDVAEQVTTEKVLEHIRLIQRSMVRDFKVVTPRIAVLGLNPHSGDEGLLGTEDQQVIIPAINSAKFENIQAFGPFAADGFFGSGTFKKFDATLAMYHDQGLAPFKAIAFADGVNFTAGLSIVRTSPAHGVGYDIAGQGIADPSPFRSALYAAIDIFRNRSFYDEITANPLQKHYHSDNRGGGRDRDMNVEDLNLADNKQA